MDDAHSKDLLVGMISWGRGWNVLPGVHARVSSQYTWIRDTVCEHSVAPPEYFDCLGNIAKADRAADTSSEQATGSALRTGQLQSSMHRPFIRPRCRDNTVHFHIHLGFHDFGVKSLEHNFPLFLLGFGVPASLHRS